MTFRANVLTISDRCSKDQAKDESGKIIIDMLKDMDGEIIKYEIVPDEADLIKDRISSYCDKLKVDFVFTTGGTGFGPRDVTPEATESISHRMAPGISELIRSEGLKKTKNAALSRGISVIRNNTIIINLPGSPKGARESLGAISSLIPHMLDMLKGKAH